MDEEAKRARRTSVKGEDIDEVRSKCVFTTHTPVPAGHDKFPVEFMTRLFPDQTRFFDVKDASSADLLKSVMQVEQNYPDFQEAARRGASVNMTYLALSLSNFVNGVAKLHGEVSRKMFPNVQIEAITNGVHAATWTCPAFRDLFDRYITSWREDNYSLRGALGLPPEEVWAAHLLAKHDLLETVRKKTGLKLDPEAFTIGFARRATGYKRADLILSDLDRLRQIAKSVGSFQIVFAGKAHPKDGGGKDIIKRIFKAKKALKKAVSIVFLDDYDMDLGGKLTSGGDLWLNTPQYPLEASGTSGMKAALNGVPSLSILDGWWVEGHIEGITGWSIGEPHRGEPSHESVGGQRSRRREYVLEAGKRNSADVLREPTPLSGSDAARHRHQRLVFQHPAHGAAVHYRRLFSMSLASACGEPDARLFPLELSSA